MARLIVPALTLVTLCACGGGAPPIPPGEGLQIGTGVGGGTAGYSPLEDGVELTLEPGAQGGFHVYIQVQADAAIIRRMGERPLVRRTARRDPSGELVSRSSRTQAFVPSGEADKVQLDSASPLFLCPTPIGIPVADETLLLEVEISADEDTPGVKGTLRFIPRCPTDNQAEFCRNICFG